mgnify:CR=1 FL=1
MARPTLPPKGETAEVHVFVLDTEKKPLAPCHPAVARKLLKQGRAAVLRRYPFTIILKEAKEATPQDIRLKIDPGSRVTGMAILHKNKVIWAAEIEHKGKQVRAKMLQRRQLRRGRRYRKTRYRKPRFLNRRKPEGWLPPSLESRIANIVTWVNRLIKLCPISAISIELVKFDTQKLQNPEISGVEYQQGELFGYEVREYLLEKWGRKCAYCGRENVPLEIEHIVPRSRGGTDRISNLTLACRKCNQKKGNLTAEEFGFSEIQKRARRPLKDAAAVNTTRWAVYRKLSETVVPVESGTGGMTKYNRTKLGLKKEHWLDAACVGESTPDDLTICAKSVLKIKAVGHGSRQRCITDRYGFPKAYLTKKKTYMGFATGDIVKAVVPRGKYAGIHIGRIAIRQRPSFRLNGVDVHPKYLTILQRGDGYEYEYMAAHSPSQ